MFLTHEASSRYCWPLRLSLYSNSCLLPKSHQLHSDIFQKSRMMRLVLILTLTDVSDHPLVVKHQRLHDHVTIEICKWIHIVDTHKVHFWTVHLLLHTQILPFTVFFVAHHCKCIGLVQKSASTHFRWGLNPGSVGDSGNEPSQLPGWSLDQTQKCFHWRKDIAILRNVSCKIMQQNLDIYKI